MDGDNSGKALQITSRSKVEVVQKLTGYNDLAWKTFLRITHAQVHDVVTQSDDAPTKWADIEYHQKVSLLAELNQRLAQQGLPEINMAAYEWRMTQAMPPVVRQYRKSKESATLEISHTAGDGLVVLPPIRDQPNLAQHIAMQDANAVEDEG